MKSLKTRKEIPVGYKKTEKPLLIAIFPGF
jgi:hypothetical protein